MALFSIRKTLQATPVTLACLAAPHLAAAQVDVDFDEDRRHHLSAVIGGSHVRGVDETPFTLGGDYEYRLNRLLGVGVVVERAFGAVDAATVLAVADVHLWRGLALQLGPGAEFVDGETRAVGRIGALYEVELAHSFTIAPQAHYDISGGEDTIVFAIALGRAF